MSANVEREVPPHRKRAMRRKPWVLQIRSTELDREWVSFAEWTNLKRYVRREDALKAAEKCNRNHRIFEYRVADAEGNVVP